MIRAEFNGIVQQIMEHLLDLFHICPGVQLFSGKNQFKENMTSGAVSLISGGSFFYGLVDIKGLNVQETFLDIQFIQGEEAFCELFQTVSLLGNDLQVFILHFHGNRTVHHCFHIAFYGGKR